MPLVSVGVQTTETCLNPWYQEGPDGGVSVERPAVGGSAEETADVRAEVVVAAAAARAAAPGARRAPGMPRGEDRRFYVVWHVPGDDEARGIWSGGFPRVWNELQSRLPRQTFAGSGAHPQVRERRCCSRRLA